MGDKRGRQSTVVRTARPHHEGETVRLRSSRVKGKACRSRGGNSLRQLSLHGPVPWLDGHQSRRAPRCLVLVLVLALGLVLVLCACSLQARCSRIMARGRQPATPSSPPQNSLTNQSTHCHPPSPFMSHPRPHDTRHRLLEAASALIWESSYSSASVDAICQRAEVNKGSFYHFFPSKAELAVAALEAEWEARKPQWDACFSPLVPPLERFDRLHAECMAEQTRLAAATGCVVGCPLVQPGQRDRDPERTDPAKSRRTARHDTCNTSNPPSPKVMPAGKFMRRIPPPRPESCCHTSKAK